MIPTLIACHFLRSGDCQVSPYLGEFIGTMILIAMGNGVVANVLLTGTKGHAGGLIVLTAGWGLSVYTAVLCVQDVSGAHLNPAVTIGVAAAGEFDAGLVPGYIAAQLGGAIAGAIIAFLFYLPHYKQTEDADLKLATFCTIPQTRNPIHNIYCEAIGTFVLVFAVLCMSDPEFTANNQQPVKIGLGSLGALRVGLIVAVIGMSLGGTTGWAINPARDLGPRIAHAILPIANKGDSGWGYSWIPVVGPIIGAVIAALFYQAVWPPA